MEKLTKGQLSEILHKAPDNVTLEDLKNIFGIFCLQIKQYDKCEQSVSFEIHFKRIFIIEITHPIGSGLMSFRNEFIETEDGKLGVAMGRVKNMIELINVFVNMFQENLLLKACWEIEYDEDNSIYDSLEEAKNI